MPPRLDRRGRLKRVAQNGVRIESKNVLHHLFLPKSVPVKTTVHVVLQHRHDTVDPWVGVFMTGLDVTAAEVSLGNFSESH